MSKKIGEKLKDFCLNIFIIYSFFSVVHTTTEILNNLLEIKSSGGLVFIIVIYLTYECIKKYEKAQEQEKEIIRIYNDISLLNYSELINIKNISIDPEGNCFCLLKNGTIRRIQQHDIPRKQEDLIKLDKKIR